MDGGGGLLSSLEEDNHRRKNDSGIQPCTAVQSSFGSRLLPLALGLALSALLCAACATTQNNLLLDSALEFQRLGWAAGAWTMAGCWDDCS